MRLSLSALDGEIDAVERAIASDRKVLEQAFVGYVDSLRETATSTITSPKFLLGALGVGFIAGKFLLRGNKRGKDADAAPMKKSMLGLLGASALSLAQAQFGGPLGLARWITTRLYQARRSSQHAKATQRAGIDTTSYGASYAGDTPTEQPAALLRR